MVRSHSLDMRLKLQGELSSELALSSLPVYALTQYKHLRLIFLFEVLDLLINGVEEGVHLRFMAWRDKALRGVVGDRHSVRVTVQK